MHGSPGLACPAQVQRDDRTAWCLGCALPTSPSARSVGLGVAPFVPWQTISILFPWGSWVRCRSGQGRGQPRGLTEEMLFGPACVLEALPSPALR